MQGPQAYLSHRLIERHRCAGFGRNLTEGIATMRIRGVTVVLLGVMLAGVSPLAASAQGLDSVSLRSRESGPGSADTRAGTAAAGSGHGVSWVVQRNRQGLPCLSAPPFDVGHPRDWRGSGGPELSGRRIRKRTLRRSEGAGQFLPPDGGLAQRGCRLAHPWASTWWAAT